MLCSECLPSDLYNLNDWTCFFFFFQSYLLWVANSTFLEIWLVLLLCSDLLMHQPVFMFLEIAAQKILMKQFLGKFIKPMKQNSNKIKAYWAGKVSRKSISSISMSAGFPGYMISSIYDPSSINKSTVMCKGILRHEWTGQVKNSNNSI